MYVFLIVYRLFVVIFVYLYFCIVGGLSIVDTLKGEGSPLCPPRLDTCVNSVNNIFVNNVCPCNNFLRNSLYFRICIYICVFVLPQDLIHVSTQSTMCCPVIIIFYIYICVFVFPQKLIRQQCLCQQCVSR